MCQRHFVLASVFVLSFKFPAVGEAESKGGKYDTRRHFQSRSISLKGKRLIRCPLC